MMTDRQINAFAAAIHEGRIDWQPPGIVAALRARNDTTDPWQLMVAMIRRAANPANRTPALQGHDLEPTPVGCRTHPTAGVRTDGQCAACWADSVAASEPQPLRRHGHPIPADARVLLDVALRRPAGNGNRCNVPSDLRSPSEDPTRSEARL